MEPQSSRRSTPDGRRTSEAGQDPAVEAHYLRGRPSPTPRPRPQPGPRHSLSPDPNPESEPPQSRAAAIARVTGLVTASALLCVAIMAAALADDHRRRTPVTITPGSAELTGARALDPQAVAGYVPAPTTSGQTITTAPASSHPPPSSPSSPPPSSHTSSSSSTSPTAAPRLRSAGSPEEVLSFVHTFYELLDSNPRDALRLVDPALVEDEGDNLVRSWESMDDVHVETIDLEEDNTVLAAVSMREQNGSRLRLNQLLRLTGPRDPLITEARVLSVERS